MNQCLVVRTSKLLTGVKPVDSAEDRGVKVPNYFEYIAVYNLSGGMSEYEDCVVDRVGSR